MDGTEYIGRLQGEGRVQIPKSIREAMELDSGTRVRVSIKKEEEEE